MAKQKMEVEVDVRPKGLGELKAKWADFAGNLLEPMVLLAAGATKAQAAWAGFRGILESRVLGPLGLVAGASLGFLATTKLLVNQWRTLGMTAAGALERMTLQFRPLLGSMDRAKERVQELSRFAVKTPFEIEELVTANKMLETLTQGALANEKGMTLVGDAASVAGQAFSSVAQYVGRLYDGLMSGRPVGEATMRLQEMGIISGTVRNQIESMQAANASGLEIWKVVEKQLQKNTGAMEQQSRSLEGLQSTHADTQKQMEGGFSSGFLEGEKAGVIASIKLMEAMTPVMQRLGKETGAVENRWETLKLKVVEGVTSWKGFGTTVEWVIKGMVGLAAILAGASTAAIAGFAIQMLKLIAGNKAAAASTAHLAAVESASLPVKQKLIAVKNALAAASHANAAGLKAEAQAQLGAAAAGMKNIAATNGMVGAVSVGRKAMTGFGMAVSFVGAQLRTMALAMLANPFVWLAAAVIGVASAFSKWRVVQKETQERLEGYLRATTALDSGLKKQIAEIRTLVDLRQAENKILNELVGAYKAVETAQNAADKSAAEDRVGVLKGRLKELPATAGLELTPQQMEREAQERAGGRQVREMERDAMAAKGPEEALKVAEERLKEIVDRRRQAMDLVNEEAAAEAKAAAARQMSVSQEAEREGLMRRQAKLQAELAHYQKEFSEGGAEVDAAAVFAKMQEKTASLADVQAQMDALALQPESSSLAEMLASPSELQQIKAKIAVMDELKAATQAVANAQDELAQNTDPTKKAGLEANVSAAEGRQRKATALAEEAGVVNAGAFTRQSMEARRDELEARRTEDMDPVRQAAAAKERRDAEAAVAQARLDAEAAVAGLRMQGYEREARLLDIEEQKLEIQKERNALGEAEYARQTEILAARREAMEREAGQRRTELAAAFEIAKLRRAEADARREGDPARAERMRKAAEEREDARTRREATKDARDAAATPEERQRFVEDRVREEREAREAERQRDEEERGRGRARTRAGQNTSVAAIEAEAARLGGRGRDARRIREDAARRQDELDREEARRRYQEQGFTRGDAAKMADKDVKLSQAERMMAEMNRGGGAVVASSLAKIGGGGNVAGTDPDRRLQERILKVLEDIRDERKKDVEREEW